MYIPKRYGESRIDKCPFCGRTALIKNSQGVPVCQSHKNHKLNDLRCMCGELLELKTGKWGPYFRCINCGNINLKKALEINPPKSPVKENKSTPKEITVRSDEVDFLY